MELSAPFKKNILALYFIKVSKWFTLVMPVIVLFYEENGLGLKDIFLLKSVYSVAVVAFEIPAGYLADVWGRKNTLLVGCSLAFGGFLCYSFSYTLVLFSGGSIFRDRTKSGLRGRLSLTVRYYVIPQERRRIFKI